MTEAEVKAMLDGLGCPVAYSHFNHPQKPPFAVYYFVEEEAFGADDGLYYADSRYNVELYTRKKSPALERKLEKLLREGGAAYEKSETYIEGEDVFEVLYQI